MTDILQMQIEARLAEAKRAYRDVSELCEIVSMSREEYIRLYIDLNFGPLTYTTGGSL